MRPPGTALRKLLGKARKQATAGTQKYKDGYKNLLILYENEFTLVYIDNSLGVIYIQNKLDWKSEVRVNSGHHGILVTFPHGNPILLSVSAEPAIVLKNRD